MRTSWTAAIAEALLSGKRVVVAAGIPEKGMRTLSILCAFTLICQPKAWSEPLDPEGGGGALPPDAIQPAFRFVQGFSDGFYDFTRLHFIDNIFPERLSRGLKAAPKEDSAPAFDRTLRENEDRFIARANAAYPAAVDGPAAENRLEAWRTWAVQEQVGVVAGSLGDTLINRYQLELFGQYSGAYAQDRRNWDPGFLSMTGVLGGAFLYVGGVHAHFDVGRLKVGLDLAPGMKFQRAFQNDGTVEHIAALSLGLKNVPLSLSTDWGLASGRLSAERVGLDYKLRF
jgi:hypothetical protein